MPNYVVNKTYDKYFIRKQMKKFISALIMLASLDVVAGSRVEQGKILKC